MASSVTLSGKYATMAYKMLKEVSALLYKYKIPYVLEAGTLLGIVRENRLLPWDNDVDITITSDHLDRLLKQRWKFFFQGYRLTVRTYKRDIGPFKKGMVRLIKVSLLKYHIIKQVNLLDIFVKYPVGEEYLWTLGVKKAVLKGAPKRFYDEHTELEFQGRKYTVPKDYTGYLEYHYGDWKTPVKEWNFRTSDNCVKELFYEENNKQPTENK